RIPLSEVQLDPDAPLPLPKFPGHSMVGSDAGPQAGTISMPRAPGTAVGQGGNRGVGGVPSDGSCGYYVPGGIVTPQQRQSHGLPPELRSMLTIPKPERLP
ncbi:unnamed protein product, partial [Choristocarpus tenellus]